MKLESKCAAPLQRVSGGLPRERLGHHGPPGALPWTFTGVLAFGRTDGCSCWKKLSGVEWALKGPRLGISPSPALGDHCVERAAFWSLRRAA